MSRLFPDRILDKKDLAQQLTDHFENQVFLDIESRDRLILNTIDSILYSGQSEYQSIDIFSTPNLGLVMALEGIIQLSESDEAIYHEFLIHPATLAHGSAKSALVLGGGDGCAARELLKYNELTTIDMVEIDSQVIEASKIHFAAMNNNALVNPRVNVLVQDAFEYLKPEAGLQYDLIFADLTEPFDLSGPGGDLSRRVFSSDFYSILKQSMTSTGILVIQTGGIVNDPKIDAHHYKIMEGLCDSFATVFTAYIFVPAYVELWSVTLASDHPYDMLSFDPTSVIADKSIGPLKHYNKDSHRQAFRKMTSG